MNVFIVAHCGKSRLNLLLELVLVILLVWTMVDTGNIDSQNHRIFYFDAIQRILLMQIQCEYFSGIRLPSLKQAHLTR